ncbi:MAG: ATP-binding cassette domain-containing protein, partial [Kiloniellales bacterium]|nr:ATP-binding cassette domain-containing protein [Kiloniellales bacterium]
MLSISGLQVGYGAFTAVHGLDLEVGRSDIFALLGANGAGKTSTLMALAGHAEVKSGQIVFDGRDITGLPAARRAAAGLAIAPEGRRLFADLSVAENLVIGGYAQPRQAAARNRARVIELFPRLGQRLAQTAGTLSGGEQQMLAIGR